MKSIVFVCISLRAGGTERVITRLANALAENWHVTIITLSDVKPFYSLDPSVRVLHFRSKESFSSKYAFYVSLLKYVRQSVQSVRPEVVFSFGELINPYIRISTALIKTPVILSNRESPIRSLKRLSGVLNLLIYPFAKTIIVQTERAAEMLGRRYRFSSFTVIPNPVEIPERMPEVLAREQVVVSVGYLGGEKNQAGLIRVFAAIAGGSGWSLHIVGDGPSRRSLECLAGSLGIQNQVSFLGEREDVSELLMGSQVFSFTSLSEGFPNALAEGMAHGCACISYDCPTGPAELIEHDVNGILVPLGDEQQYQRELGRLLSDKALRERLGKQARLDIRKYSSEKVLGQFQELIAASGG